MQSFSFKTAKLTDRVIVEVDRRWTRSATRKGQVHIDFSLVARLHYWITVSRGAALTGHLVIKDRQGRKLALQCAGFGMDKDFVEFLRRQPGATTSRIAAQIERTPKRRCRGPDALVRNSRVLQLDGRGPALARRRSAKQAINRMVQNCFAIKNRATQAQSFAG